MEVEGCPKIYIQIVEELRKNTLSERDIAAMFNFSKNLVQTIKFAMKYAVFFCTKQHIQIENAKPIEMDIENVKPVENLNQNMENREKLIESMDIDIELEENNENVSNHLNQNENKEYEKVKPEKNKIPRKNAHERIHIISKKINRNRVVDNHTIIKEMYTGFNPKSIEKIRREEGSMQLLVMLSNNKKVIVTYELMKEEFPGLLVDFFVEHLKFPS